MVIAPPTSCCHNPGYIFQQASAFSILQSATRLADASRPWISSQCPKILQESIHLLNKDLSSCIYMYIYVMVCHYINIYRYHIVIISLSLSFCKLHEYSYVCIDKLLKIEVYTYMIWYYYILSMGIPGSWKYLVLPLYIYGSYLHFRIPKIPLIDIVNNVGPPVILVGL